MHTQSALAYVRNLLSRVISDGGLSRCGFWRPGAHTKKHERCVWPALWLRGLWHRLFFYMYNPRGRPERKV